MNRSCRSGALGYAGQGEECNPVIRTRQYRQCLRRICRQLRYLQCQFILIFQKLGYLVVVIGRSCRVILVTEQEGNFEIGFLGVIINLSEDGAVSGAASDLVRAVNGREKDIAASKFIQDLLHCVVFVSPFQEPDSLYRSLSTFSTGLAESAKTMYPLSSAAARLPSSPSHASYPR